MRVLRIRALAVFGSTIVVPALIVACSSSSNTGDDVIVLTDSGPGRDGTVESTDSSMFGDDGSTLKPSPQAVEAGVSDAAPTSRPDAGRPKGAGDAGKLVDAGLTPDAKAPPTGTGDPLDPIDQSLMPDYGFDEGTCASEDLTDSTGRCYNDFFTGADYVEGCVTPDSYLLDCARYDTAGSTRSICEDDPTIVGCVLIDVAQVASFEASQMDSYLDQDHACPSSWEGYGYCQGDFISLCQGGEDYWLDCSIYDTGPFTYTCGTDTDGHIACL